MSYEVIPTTETNHTLGKNIKVFRSEMGLSQQQIADYLGINRVEVSYYETHSSNGTDIQIGGFVWRNRIRAPRRKP